MKKLLVYSLLLLSFAGLGQTIHPTSTLPSATTLTGTEYVPVVQGGTSKKITVGQLPYYAVFDITKYGAVGDSSTNNYTAIAACLAAARTASSNGKYTVSMKVPGGAFIASGSGFVIDFPLNIIGEGLGSFNLYSVNNPDFNSGCAIYWINPTNPLFTFTNNSLNHYPVCSISNIDLHYAYSTTPSAGSAGVVFNNNAQQWSMRNVMVSGFYIDVDIQAATYWLMDNCRINAPVNSGVRLSNNIDSDIGDWCVSNTIFSSSGNTAYSNAYGFYWKAGGGGKIVNCKWNSTLYSPTASGFKYSFYADMSGGATSDLQITNCSFENFTAAAIYMNNTSGGLVSNIIITGNEIAPVNPTGQSAIFINNYNNVILHSNTGRNYVGTIAAPFYTVTNCNGVKVDYANVFDFTSFVNSNIFTSNTNVSMPGVQLAGVYSTYTTLPALSFNYGFNFYTAQSAAITLSLGSANIEGVKGRVTIDGDGTHSITIPAGWVNKGSNTPSNTQRNIIDLEYTGGLVIYSVVTTTLPASLAIISDNFSGGNTTDMSGRTVPAGTLTGVTWTKNTTTCTGGLAGTIGIASGACLLTSANTTCGQYTVNSGSITADVRVTVGGISTTSGHIAPLVLLSYASVSSVLLCNYSNGSVYYGTNSSPTIASCLSSVAIGDVIRFTLTGSAGAWTVSCYQNGTLKGSATLSSSLTSTNHGVYYYQDNTSSITKYEQY